MNRPLEFRAWSNELQKMSIDTIDLYDTNKHSYFTFRDDLGYKSPGRYDLENDNFVLMQFTGLLDKNGTKIFEGDIVMFANDYPSNPFGDNPEPGEPHNDFAKVVFKNGCFGLEIIGEDSRENIGDFFLINDIEEDFGDIEVIGNIYENPELLTTKE